jgi:superfamily II DNA or RNA helicase
MVSDALPLVPAGPDGLVYIITGFSPIGGEGGLEILERRHRIEYVYNYFSEEPEAIERVELTPLNVDRGFASRLRDPLDRQIAGMTARLPRLKAMVAGHSNGPKKGRPSTARGSRRDGGGGSARGGNGGAVKVIAGSAKAAASRATEGACFVSEDAWRRLLPLLVETERLYIEVERGQEVVAVEKELLPPYEFQLALDFGNRAGEYHLTGRFVRDERPLPFEAQALLVADGEKGLLLRISGRLSDVDFDGSVAWLRALRRGRFQRVSKRSLSKLYKVFERSTTLPPIWAPQNLGIGIVRGARPRPELKLDSGPQEVVGEVSFRYGDEDIVRAARPGRCFFSTRTGNVVIRDLQTESARAVRLLDLGFVYNPSSHQFTLTADRLPNAAPELFEQGWTITGKGMPFRPPTDMEVDVVTAADHIELSVTVHFGDQVVGLPALLGAIHDGNRMIPLGRGVIGVLPFEWLEKNAAWMSLGELRGERLIFRRNQSAVVDALLNENIKTKLDDGFKAERERLAGFQGIDVLEPSENFKGELRTYQKLGLGWLRFLDQMAWGGCLADDMGLGKTVQALALIQLLKEAGREGPTLIVTPKSLIFNWMREAKRFTPNLKTFAYTGMKRAQFTDRLDEFDIVLTTYGTVRRDIAKLAAKQFFYVILDEGQAIKNPDSQNAKAVMLLPGERKLILSGTPIENHLGELWSLYQFLNPGMLGSANAFKQRFGSGRDLDSASLQMLRRTLRPFILRRKKEEVATDLPEKIEETIICEMEPEQKKIYARVKEKARSSVLAKVKQSGVARSKLHILEALLRMRQAACHPALINDEYKDMPSGKFKVLMSMLEEVEDEGHKVLIFSQFTSLLAILREELDRAGKVYEYLDGQTTNREGRVDHFQNDPSVKFFLISLKAGGVGLNLTAADYVFILDPWWNPAVEAQAIDRAHRIGQDKKVFAYRFVAADSIEERIAILQDSKRKLADSIVAGSDSLLREMSKNDLEFLCK